MVLRDSQGAVDHQVLLEVLEWMEFLAPKEIKVIMALLDSQGFLVMLDHQVHQAFLVKKVIKDCQVLKDYQVLLDPLDQRVMLALQAYRAGKVNQARHQKKDKKENQVFQVYEVSPDFVASMVFQVQRENLVCLELADLVYLEIKVNVDLLELLVCLAQMVKRGLLVLLASQG